MFLKIGDKIVECDENRVIKATSKEIKYADGRVDMQVFVPSLKIQGNRKPTEKELEEFNITRKVG